MEKCVFPFPSPSLRLARHKFAFNDLADLSSEPAGTGTSPSAGHPAYQNDGPQGQVLRMLQDEELLAQIDGVRILKDATSLLGQLCIKQFIEKDTLAEEAAAHLAKIAELENQVLKYKKQALAMEEKIRQLEADKAKLEKSNADLLEDKRQDSRAIDHLRMVLDNDTRGRPGGN